MRIEFDTLSDRGLNPHRPINEDRVAAFADKGVFIVCDGVGGQSAGEVASQTVVEVAGELLGRPRPLGSSRQVAQEIIAQANSRIYQLASASAEYRGMATTVAMVIVRKFKATIAHVGDSRVYWLHRGKFEPLTVDHSFVEDAVRSGHFEASQVPENFRNIISRALGSEPAVEGEISEVDAEDGDWFLLCSDGVTRHLSNDELGAILRESGGARAACERVRDECFERGAEDNLSVIVLRFLNADEDVEKTAPSIRRRKDASPIAGPATRFEVPMRWEEENAVSPTAQTARLVEGRRSRAPRTWSWSKIVFLVFCTAVLVVFGYSLGKWAQPLPPPAQTPAPAPPISSECEREIAKARALTAPGSKPFVDGLIAFCAGHYREAIESLSAATQLEPKNAEIVYWLARSQDDAGDSGQAIADYEKAKALGSRREDIGGKLARLKKGSP